MIVQIPVENAIKHGLAGKDGEKELTIRISREGKGVRIVICDNGRGIFRKWLLRPEERERG